MSTVIGAPPVSLARANAISPSILDAKLSLDKDYLEQISAVASESRIFNKEIRLYDFCSRIVTFI